MARERVAVREIYTKAIDDRAGGRRTALPVHEQPFTASTSTNNDNSTNNSDNNPSDEAVLQTNDGQYTVGGDIDVEGPGDESKDSNPMQFTVRRFGTPRILDTASLSSSGGDTALLGDGASISDEATTSSNTTSRSTNRSGSNTATTINILNQHEIGGTDNIGTADSNINFDTNINLSTNSSINSCL